jgi:hypothetical protein
MSLLFGRMSLEADNNYRMDVMLRTIPQDLQRSRLFRSAESEDIANWVRSAAATPASSEAACRSQHSMAPAREWLLRIVAGRLARLFHSDFVARASSTRRRIASERDGLSGCSLAQASIFALRGEERRIADTGSRPVAGRPRFFGTTFFLDGCRIFW